MEHNFLPLAITCVGTVVLLLVAAVSFFVMMFIKDVKQHSLDIAQLRGNGATQVQKIDGDMRLLTERTEMQIQQLTKNVDALASTVKTVFENIVNRNGKD